MWAAVPLVEAGAVAIIGVVAGAKVTKKVMERIDKKKAKALQPSKGHPRRPSKESNDDDADADFDDFDSKINSDGSAFPRHRRGEHTRNAFHESPHSQNNDAHIMQLLQSLPKRKFLLANLAPEDDCRRQRGSKWRSVSPYGAAADEPEWIQQAYSSHEEWYDDLDSDSKLAYLGHLYDLLKQARKKSTKELQQSLSRRRRGYRSNLYTLLEQQALSERKNDERGRTRPMTPMEDFRPQDPRISSWVNTQVPSQAFERGYYPNATEGVNNTRGPRSRNQDFEDGYYASANEFRDNTRGPHFGDRARGQKGNGRVDEGNTECSGSEKGESTAKPGRERQQLNTGHTRHPRSRSSTPFRDRSRSRAVDLYQEDNEF